MCSSLAGEGDNILNTFFNNWSYFSSFVKRTTICILLIECYMVFFIQLKHCEAMPKPLQPEPVEVRKIVHESTNSTVMPSISFVSHDKPTIFGCLSDRVQFRLKSINDFFGLVGSLVLGVPCVGKEVIEPHSDKNKQQPGNSQLSSDNGWFTQAVLLLVIVPLITAIICIFYSHNGWPLCRER